MTHWLFVTGKLAEPALRRMLLELAPRLGFAYSLAVLPISAVSLATTAWIGRHLAMPDNVDRVMIPGLCIGDLAEVREAAKVPVDRGPGDFRDLPEFFGSTKRNTNYGQYDISILAEINHAPRLSIHDVIQQAVAYRASGADIIDVGCDPGDTWSGAGETVRVLRQEGLRVSIDSFNAAEVEAGVRAGAELVLSVNSSNLGLARQWGCEVVVIPDDPATLSGLDQSIETLTGWGVPFRIDPIIEPIGFGFAASLGRYLEVRRRYPQAELFMGIGNLTELTDGDSAGVNLAILAFCQELGIRSVLTTEVINWCRSSVKELDLARRLVYHACNERILPKHIEPDLVMLRDPKLREHGQEFLRQLAEQVKDHHFRIFAERDLIHVLNNKMHRSGADPFALFKEMQQVQNIDPSHAFYLGYEMAKAVTALTLGKNYHQDQALRWGFLTRVEDSD